MSVYSQINNNKSIKIMQNENELNYLKKANSYYMVSIHQKEKYLSLEDTKK